MPVLYTPSPEDLALREKVIGLIKDSERYSLESLALPFEESLSKQWEIQAETLNDINQILGVFNP